MEIEVVRQYYKMGWNVMPLLPNSKKPVGTWKEYQTCRMTPSCLKEFSGRKTNYNLALLTGKTSGIDVVDCDGEKAYQWALKNLTKSPLRAKTPRGYHLYYEHVEGSRNFQCRDDLPNIDLRADGGYVVLPPSVIDNKQYTWLDNDIALAPVPLPLDALTINKKFKDAKEFNIPQRVDGKSSVGNRHFKAIQYVGSLIGRKFDIIDVTRLMYERNYELDSPLPSDDIKKIIINIWKKEHDK